MLRCGGLGEVGQGDGGVAGGADALEGAEDTEKHHIRSESAADRGDHEQGQAGEDDGAASDMVGDRTPDEEGGGVAEAEAGGEDESGSAGGSFQVSGERVDQWDRGVELHEDAESGGDE